MLVIIELIAAMTVKLETKVELQSGIQRGPNAPDICVLGTIIDC